MSYQPNDIRVVNTVVSGSSLESHLTGHEIRLLEFDAANRRVPAKVLASGNNSLTVTEWMQSAVDTLLLDGAGMTGGTGTINLGPDAGSQAAAYVALFNFQSTSDERLLRFATNKTPVANIAMGNSNGTTVRVRTAACVGGTPANSTNLFSTSAASLSPTGPYNYGCGAERLVVVTASNIDKGSEAVTFSVLPYSA
jgi:hypothetical protein